MILLAADIGTRRTGIALADTEADFVMALDTIRHAADDELVSRLTTIVKERKASELIVGLPRLPQGEEGSQAEHVRGIVDLLKKTLSIPVTLVDERYSSLGSPKGSDPDAKAACDLLTVVLGQRKKGY
jgi:putative Holliday junction resolvase